MSVSQMLPLLTRDDFCMSHAGKPFDPVLFGSNGLRGSSPCFFFSVKAATPK